MAKQSEEYTAQEATRRVEKALRAAFSTPHKTYEESKVGKRKTAARKSPAKRRAVEKRD